MERTLRAAATASDVAAQVCRIHPVLAVAACATSVGMALSFELFAPVAAWCATVLWIGHRLGDSPLFQKVGMLVAAVAVLQPFVVVAQDILRLSLAPALVLAHLALLGGVAALEVELFRQPLGHPAIAWALRLGGALALLGMILDPERGLPALRDGAEAWRPAHLLGLRGLQLLPAAGWAVSRSRKLRAPHQVTLVVVAAASYCGVMLVLGWQAARGQPLWAPDPLTIAALVVVLAGGASSAASVLAHGREVQHLHSIRSASERRLAMLARTQLAQKELAAQDQMARARRAALQQRVTQGLLRRGAAIERDQGAMPGATLRMRRMTTEQLGQDERPTEIELLAV